MKKIYKFKDFINEASLTASNLSLHLDRIDTFEKKMLEKQPFHLEDGTELVFPLTPNNIDEIERMRNHKSNDKYSFEDENGAFHKISDFTKTTEFGSNKSLNSKGQALADAGERATALSFTQEINNPEDTGEKLFIENPDAFERWKPSFILTKKALESLYGENFEKKFDIIHDATSTSNFSNLIKTFCNKIGVNKDSWNPADIWLINKQNKTEIEKILHEIITNFDEKNLIIKFNSTIFNMFEENKLIPVSLKQITSKNFTIEENNKPGSIIPNYKVEIKNFITNLKMDTVEIGSFNFINKENNAKITFQTKGYPKSSDSVQTEITSDGTKTGGRLGKVPSYIIKRVYEENGFFKIVPAKYFKKDLSKTDKKQIKEWSNYYKFIVKNKESKGTLEPSEIEEYLTKLVTRLKTKDDIKTFKHKIQGLAMQYFLLKNKNDISNIITKYILGAKKINPEASFFLKIF